MSIILSLIIEIGCLEPSSIIEAGLVKSKSLTLLPTSLPRVSLSSTIFFRVTFFSSLIANPYSFFLEGSTFLNSEK